MILIEEELSLIEAAKEYLYTFLSEFGEFLPFAMIMHGDEIFPIEYKGNSRSFTPTYLLNIYENYFYKERRDDNEYKLGLLCIDIFTHAKSRNSKRNGVEYRLFGINYTKRAIQYYNILNDKTVLFEEMVGCDSGENADDKS